MGPGVESSRAVQEAIAIGASWEVLAYYDSANGWLEVLSLTSVTLPPVAKAPPPPPQTPTPGPAADACGLPAGTAVVTIADPKLDKLNVRAGPGGKILGAIPKGTQVSIVGPCGAAGSAGLSAPKPAPSASGWCQIESPVAGCVSAKYLVPGAAARRASPQAPETPPAATTSFAGAWDTVAAGVAHSITFDQNGASVTGAYSAADGSSGTISGQS